jgi:hypothetical protein
VAEAAALRARMLKVAGYFLDDDPEHAPEVAAIRAGTGYKDVANDLYALASLYAKYKALFAHDRRHCRAGDAREAKRLADSIIASLGGSGSDHTQGVEQQSRAYTSLERVCGEVGRGGSFLHWSEGPGSKFPSLVSAARATPSAKPKPAPGDPAADAIPA